MQVTQKTHAPRQKEIWQDRVFHWVIMALIVLVLVITLYPLYLVVICSFSDANLVTTGQVTLYPKGITLLGYNSVFQNQEIWRSYLNSILYTVSGTVISLAVTIGAAFTLPHMLRQWLEAMPEGADVKSYKAAQGYEFYNRLFELERVFEKRPAEKRLR